MNKWEPSTWSDWRRKHIHRFCFLIVCWRRGREQNSATVRPFYSFLMPRNFILKRIFLCENYLQNLAASLCLWFSKAESHIFQLIIKLKLELKLLFVFFFRLSRRSNINPYPMKAGHQSWSERLMALPKAKDCRGWLSCLESWRGHSYSSSVNKLKAAAKGSSGVII